MISMKVTRRQFLKWLSASAAALGLSQTDLLKWQEALAAVTACEGTGPRVIWITGANCSGCSTSLLNYIANPNDPIPELAAVPVAYADFEGDGNIDVAEVVLEIVTVDWHYIVAAAAGDVLNAPLPALRNAGGYVLVIEGAIQTAANGKYCRVFELPGDYRGGIWEPYVIYTVDPDLGPRTEFTMAGASLWLAANAVAVLAVGTCASWGGIPAAKNSVTGAMSAWEWINKTKGLNKTIVNVPGCPFHPDWFIYPVAYLIIRGTLPPLDTTLDHKLRPRLTPKAIFDKTSYIYCVDCLRYKYGMYATTLCDARRRAAYPKGRCMKNVGCNGYLSGPAYVRADCPTRKWNPLESYPGGVLKLTKNNYCQWNNYPCQGCTDPGFPDKSSPFFSSTKGY